MGETRLLEMIEIIGSGEALNFPEILNKCKSVDFTKKIEKEIENLIKEGKAELKIDSTGRARIYFPKSK